MARTLPPRGKENAQMQIRFVRYEEAPNYFKMDEELLYAYAKAAGAVYQLAKIRLIKIEVMEEYMKHLTRVGHCSNKKAMVKFGASGKATHPCPQCGKFIEFDYDTMSAQITRAERGATQRFKTIAKCVSEVSLSR